MTTRAHITIGLVGIALLLGGSLGIIAVVTNEAAAPVAGGSPLVMSRPAPTGETLTPAVEPIAGSSAPAGGPPAAVSAGSSASSPERPLNAISSEVTAKIAASIKRPPHRLSRGTAAPVELFRALRDWEERVRRCARDPSVRHPLASSPVETLLLLELESRPGKVTVVGTPSQGKDSASEEVIRCAQRELLGSEIAVGAAQEVAHFTLPLRVKL